MNATTLPLLVTSRVDEYRAAVESTDVLTAAAAVVLDDLTATDLADYLPRTTRRTGAAGSVWEPVLGEVRDRPDGDLAAVLTTPLMVSLARTIYSDTPDHDPAELLDIDRFESTASARAPPARQLRAHRLPPAAGPPRPRPDRVEHWLGFLAHHLDKLGTRNLAWWQLGNRMPGWQRMVVSGLVLGHRRRRAGRAGHRADLRGRVGTSGRGLSDGCARGRLGRAVEWLAVVPDGRPGPRRVLTVPRHRVRAVHGCGSASRGQ